MLRLLKIKNIALLEQVNIEFDKGLSVLTGETGAGKSIIIDGISFVLGARADKGLIRYGTDSASVTAVFDYPSGGAILDELETSGVEPDDSLIVTRTLNINGKSTANINGMPVPANTLKKILAKLIDLHSQSEHQSLFDEDTHIAVLDNYIADIEPLKSQLCAKLAEIREIKSELKSLMNKDDREDRIAELKEIVAEIN
ncbi:MAG: AAA family ATPase, partial [Christensenellaceae bacterium]|nr:AAA family ATPase [Christensenellaceae bacterium]